eukprot:c5263_g1_i1.p1 GENE.c5263_g1_i1~~c5263_g1_i1.p1  ORF type:complete len:278 (-),score=48.43 c5263_g1_i1:194-1027(-)
MGKNTMAFVGTCKWFDRSKGHGFITAADGRDIFVHFSSLQMEGFKAISQGQEVAFDIEKDQKGREHAAHVKGPVGAELTLAPPSRRPRTGGERRKRGPPPSTEPASTEAEKKRVDELAAKTGLTTYWNEVKEWNGEYYMEVQQPWSTKILDKEKTVETRTYPYPKELLGKVVYMIESAEGTPGKSEVPDSVPAGSKSVRVVGEVVVRESIVYYSKAAWDGDFSRHLVSLDNPYGWSESKVFYGWVVGPRPKKYTTPREVKQLVRVKRSIFRAVEPKK